MRIIIPSVQVPFINGGAQLMTAGLADALRRAGHAVEIVTIPFKFSPESYIENLIDYCRNQDFNNFNGYRVDKVIALQFPAYYVQHDNKEIWLMHQHRAVYDLYEENEASEKLKKLRKKIVEADNLELSRCQKIFSMSANVSKRLEQFNNLRSEPIYHPPFGEDKFYCKDAYNYIFCPSRLETLKRQDLLIKAMEYTRSPVRAIISGEGGQEAEYLHLVETLGVEDKVQFVGHISEEEKYAYYARSLGVFFGPYDEDYGYVTLEAMLSSTPVISCFDSGGPLEFLEDGYNGFICNPNPIHIAEKIDWLYFNNNLARQYGENGRQEYFSKNITWENVINKILNN